MRKLAAAIQAVRKRGIDVPATLERGLLARARTLKRRERDRIKSGTITEKAAETASERAALDEFLATVTTDLEKLDV